jgi:alpha/beta superfamily hydrolase
MTRARTLRIQVENASITLEGRVTSASSPAGLALIAPPHPMYGGSIDNPVVRALEAAFQAEQFATLAFNFRGTGDSDGEQHGDLDEALADLVSAARADLGLAERPPLSVLSGYSFGSCVALRAAPLLGISRVVLVAPPLALLDVAWLRAFTGRLDVVVGDDDEYAPEAALRETLAVAGAFRLEVLDEVDHFFSGSQLLRLRAALPALLR